MRAPRHPIAAASPRGLALEAAVLAVAAALAWSLRGDHPARSEAVAAAAGACLAGLLGSWVASRWRSGTPAARVSATLAVVGLRLFPALGVLGWLQTQGGTRLREAGAGEMLLVFYLAVLAADVILNIMGAGGDGPGAGPTTAN